MQPLHTYISGSLLVLVIGAFLLSCERQPSDFDGEPYASTIPLQRASLSNARQSMSVNGFTFTDGPVASTGRLEDDSLFTVTGKIDKVGDQHRLTLSLEVRFPEGESSGLTSFSEPQLKGFSIYLDTLQITDQAGYQTTTQCPEGKARMALGTLTVRGKEYLWSESGTVPAEGTISMNLEQVPDNPADSTSVSPHVRGYIQIEGAYSAKDGSTIAYRFDGDIDVR